MGRGAMVLYLETPESTEVAGSAAIPFTAANLTEKLQWGVEVSSAERAEWGAKAMRRIDSLYSWNVVTDAYEALFRRMTGSGA